MYVSLADVLSLYQSLFRQYLTAENVISLITISNSYSKIKTEETLRTRMWANAQPDGRPAEHRWRPLFNAAKFG